MSGTAGSPFWLLWTDSLGTCINLWPNPVKLNFLLSKIVILEKWIRYFYFCVLFFFLLVFFFFFLLTSVLLWSMRCANVAKVKCNARDNQRFDFFAFSQAPKVPVASFLCILVWENCVTGILLSWLCSTDICWLSSIFHSLYCLNSAVDHRWIISVAF